MNADLLTISVALCTYNGAEFIFDQFASLMKQKRRPDEIVICDDCSTDGTVDRLRACIGLCDIPIRLYTNPSTLGYAKNFEQAISHCNGDVIALCDQDDVWLPHKLDRLETEFAKRHDLGAIFPMDWS